jgi:outer membrane receptor for Fe3+-dicitrate
LEATPSRQRRQRLQLLLRRLRPLTRSNWKKLLERYEFTLKVGNVLDRRYFEGVNSTTNEIGVVPGAPRSVLLALRVALY